MLRLRFTMFHDHTSHTCTLRTRLKTKNNWVISRRGTAHDNGEFREFFDFAQIIGSDFLFEFKPAPPTNRHLLTFLKRRVFRGGPVSCSRHLTPSLSIHTFSTNDPSSLGISLPKAPSNPWLKENSYSSRRLAMLARAARVKKTFR